MDTLHDRLAELADDAPTGGAPAAELWARGRRAHRLRALALAATVLVVCAVGAGIGVGLAGGGDDRTAPVPAASVGVVLPIEYPVGKNLPDLGSTPGPLAAIWLVSRFGSAPEAVGLVAQTGRFGTLPLDLPAETDPQAPESVSIALSPDGRRLAHPSPTSSLVVHDLVSGESSSPLSGFETRAGYVWSDATHLFGHVAGGSDVDAWVWEPGTAPTLIDLRTYDGDPNIRPHGVGRDVRVVIQGGGPRSCSPPTLENNSPTLENPDRWEVPELCDVLGIVQAAFLLGHGNSDRLSGDVYGAESGNGTVVAVSLKGRLMTYNGRPVPPVVVTAGAPERVALATDLVGDLVFDADGGAS